MIKVALAATAANAAVAPSPAASWRAVEDALAAIAAITAIAAVAAPPTIAADRDRACGGVGDGDVAIVGRGSDPRLA